MPSIPELITNLHKEITTLQQQISTTTPDQLVVSEISNTLKALEPFQNDFPSTVHADLNIISIEQYDALNTFLSEHRFSKNFFSGGFWGYQFSAADQALLFSTANAVEIQISLETIDALYAQLYMRTFFFTLCKEHVPLLDSKHFDPKTTEEAKFLNIHNRFCNTFFNLERSAWALQYLSCIKDHKSSCFLLPQFLLQKKVVEKKLKTMSSEQTWAHYQAMYKNAYQAIQDPTFDDNLLTRQLRAQLMLDGCVYSGAFHMPHTTDIQGGRALLLELDNTLIENKGISDAKIALLIAKSYYDYGESDEEVNLAIPWLLTAFERGGKKEAAHYLKILHQYGIVREDRVFLRSGSAITEEALKKLSIPAPKPFDFETENRQQLDWIKQWLLSSRRLSSQNMLLPIVILTFPEGDSYTIRIEDEVDQIPEEIFDTSVFDSPFNDESSRAPSPFAMLRL